MAVSDRSLKQSQSFAWSSGYFIWNFQTLPYSGRTGCTVIGSALTYPTQLLICCLFNDLC